MSRPKKGCPGKGDVLPGQVADNTALGNAGDVNTIPEGQYLRGRFSFAASCFVHRLGMARLA